MRIISLAVLCALLLSGCGGPSRSPEQVAEAFWLAVLADDLDGVRANSTADSAANMDLSMLELDATVSFGEADQSPEAATVLTQLQDPAGETPAVEVPTTLSLEDGEWRVEATETLTVARQELASDAARDIRQLGEEIRRSERKCQSCARIWRRWARLPRSFANPSTSKYPRCSGKWMSCCWRCRKY